MNTFLDILAKIWFLVFIAGAVSSVYNFESIIMLEYRRYRDQWESDGKPASILWGRRGVGHLPPWKGMPLPDRMSSDISGLVFLVLWLFNTPKWIAGDPELKRHLYWYRFSTLGTIGLVAATIVLLAK